MGFAIAVAKMFSVITLFWIIQSINAQGQQDHFQAAHDAVQEKLTTCDRRVHCDTMSPLPEHCSISQCVIMFSFASTARLQYFK